DEPETAGAGSSGIECAAQSGELVVAPDERSRLCGKPISAAHGVLTGSAHVDGLCHRYRRFRRRPSTQLRCLQSSRATKEIQTDSRSPRIAIAAPAPLVAASGSFESPRVESAQRYRHDQVWGNTDEAECSRGGRRVRGGPVDAVAREWC